MIEFSTLLNTAVITDILQLCVFSWAAGYGAGYLMMLIRRYSHSVVD